MSNKSAKSHHELVLPWESLPRLFETITAAGYRIIGPTVRDRTMVLEEIKHVDSLPIGRSDQQGPARYRLSQGVEKTVFDFSVSQHTWKRFLFPPRQTVCRLKRTKTGFEVDRATVDPARLALLGVRPCELAALKIQDRIFVEGEYVDPYYAEHRMNLLVIAVNCTRAGGTCFCGSMGTGPQAADGYDIALTELHDSNSHYFICRADSQKGRELLGGLALKNATTEQLKLESEMLAVAAKQMGRVVDTKDIKEMLYRNVDSRHWDHIGKRCLSCGNCTMVCPTCFCSAVDDYTDFTGATAERVRRWDSCFTMDYSYIHGGSVRPSARARYRQWLTHKFASWIDQFGTPGCVGCGRCITWCPVGIDITEELKALRETDAAHNKTSESLEVQNANA